jgi:hypothetical protein
MISNFLQKPAGVVTLVATAIGAPYAAFETELGTAIRRSLIQASQSAGSNQNGAFNGIFNQAGQPFSNANDPNSLTALNASNRQDIFPASQANSYQANSYQPNSYQPSSPNTSQYNAPYNAPYNAQTSPPTNVQPYPAQPTNSQSYQSMNNGQLVSTTYGPATIIPLGASGSPVLENRGLLDNRAILENRVGPSSVVNGNVDQLWDYTLGTPSLPQIQQQPQTAIGGGTIPDLREVLRFDITPGWLPQRFARVTTVTSNVQLDGLRVPLITGTQPYDIAGSLTYYFDAVKQLKRIHLHGLTGDPSQLSNLMVQYYHLQPEASLGGQMFTARWNNRVTSVMQIAPAPVIYAGADHSKYTLFLELNQPSNQYALSDEASEILKTSQATQRWQ